MYKSGFYSKWLLIGIFFLLFRLVHAGEVSGYLNVSSIVNKYPQLIDHVKRTGSLKVQWIAQSGTKQTAIFSFTRDGHFVCELNIITMSDDRQVVRESVAVRMIDRSLNGILERIIYKRANGQAHIFDYPQDQASLTIWNVALSAAIKYSNCCSS